MHPLLTFPQILFLGLFGVFLLRIAIGLTIVSMGWDRYGKKMDPLFLIYFIPGAIIFVGIYTQIGAIFGILVMIFDFYIENKNKNISRDKKTLYMLSLVILIAILVMGPGIPAFDRPL